jgi:hypothetical protein
MGEANSAQGVDEVHLCMTRRRTMLFEIRECSVKGAMVCGHYLCSKIIWREQCSHADRLRCNEQKLKGFNFSTIRCQGSNSRKWLAPKKPSKTFFMELIGWEIRRSSSATPCSLQDVEVLKFPSGIAQVVVEVN